MEKYKRCNAISFSTCEKKNSGLRKSLLMQTNNAGYSTFNSLPSVARAGVGAYSGHLTDPLALLCGKKHESNAFPQKIQSLCCISSYCKRRQRSPIIRADRTHGLLQTSLRRARSCCPFGWPGVRRYQSERKECGEKMLGWTGADDEERKFCCEWDGDGKERISFLSMKKTATNTISTHISCLCLCSPFYSHCKRRFHRFRCLALQWRKSPTPWPSDLLSRSTDNFSG